MKNIIKIFIIILSILIFKIALFAAQTQPQQSRATQPQQSRAALPQQSAPTQQQDDNRTPQELTRGLNSNQDTIRTQPMENRENQTFEESLQIIQQTEGKKRYTLTEDLSDVSQYGIRKQVYLRFHAGIGWALISDQIESPTNYNWPLHYLGQGAAYGAKMPNIVYDFTFMPVIKISKRRGVPLGLGFGIEAGFMHLTNMHSNKYSPYDHYWGIPINFIIQVPLAKLFDRTKDLLLLFGAGAFIPAHKVFNDVMASLMVGAEYNIPLTSTILLPLFAKIRFLFRNKLYLSVEVGTGITF